MAGPSLNFSNVNVQLGGQRILSGVTLDLAAGGIHCIVGPNGGGKTTLIRAALGQIPFDGRIAFAGSDAPVVGYAPQSLDIDRTIPLTVRDFMSLMTQRRPVFLGHSRRHRAASEAALDRVGLRNKADRLFGVLSGGERQRLLFAQALVPMPDLLIMDEPTSNMDEEGARLVESIVVDLNRDGLTVVWINHDWEQVRRVATSVAYINRRLIAHGEPEATLAAGLGSKVAA